MDDAATRTLLQRLLASDEVWPETKEELTEFLAELDRGQLDRNDRVYIEKLAARLDGLPPAPETEAEAPPATSLLDDLRAALAARLDPQAAGTEAERELRARLFAELTADLDRIATERGLL